MKKSFVFLSLNSLLLFGCASNETTESVEDSNEDTEEIIEQVEESESEIEVEEESWEEALEGVEFDTEDDDEIQWDKINLTKRQYSQFISDIADETKEDPEAEIYIDFVQFDGETIEFKVINEEANTEMAELSNSFYVFFMDSYIRQFYLVSDYSDGETHPTIIFNNKDGEVISESSTFLTDE